MRLNRKTNPWNQNISNASTSEGDSNSAGGAGQEDTGNQGSSSGNTAGSENTDYQGSDSGDTAGSENTDYQKQLFNLKEKLLSRLKDNSRPFMDAPLLLVLPKNY